jgi:hypothetical protein
MKTFREWLSDWYGRYAKKKSSEKLLFWINDLPGGVTVLGVILMAIYLFLVR